MEIQVSTDRALRGGRELAAFVGYEIVAGLGSFADRVTSALVELTEDKPAPEGSTRLRCQLEVRPLGHAPIVVSRLAATGDTAVRGAVQDLSHVLERMFSRIDGHAGPG
jgi:hypothetical protein